MNAKRKATTTVHYTPGIDETKPAITKGEILAAEYEKRRKLQIDLRRHLEHELDGACRRMDGDAAGLYMALLDGDWLAAQAWGLAALCKLLRRAEANQ